MSTEMIEIKTGRSIDLYEHGRRRREKVEILTKLKIISDGIEEFVKDYEPPKVLSANEFEMYKFCADDISTEGKEERWSNMTVKRLVRMDNGEYKAFREFVNV
jgi:hypothetical protein